MVQLSELIDNWITVLDISDNVPDFVKKSSQVNLTITRYSRPKTWKEIFLTHQRVTEEILSQYNNILSTGNFQTKSGLALPLVDHLFDNSNYLNKKNFSIMDPTCGTGVFLLAAVKRFVNGIHHSGNYQNKNTSLRIIGIERDPVLLTITWLFLQVISKKIDNDKIQLIGEFFHCDLLDFINNQRTLKKKNGKDVGNNQTLIDPVDLIIGNPPWITWTDLSDEDRTKWKAFSKQSDYDYIVAEGISIAMGQSNIDIGPVLFLFAIDTCSHENTIFGFLFKPEMLNSSSLYWYRRGKIAKYDKNMENNKNKKIVLTSIFAIRSDENFINLDMQTDFFIGRILVDRKEILQRKSSIIELYEYRNPSVTLKADKTSKNRIRLRRVELNSPVDYFYLSDSLFEHENESILNILKNQPNDVEIRHGIKHDCKEVFEISENRANEFNWSCVYPTVKSRHIKKTGWNGKYDLIIIPHRSLKTINEQQFADKHPKVYQYLLDNKTKLENRKSRWLKHNAFYALFGIGEYSFSSYKIAWVRLGWKPYFVIIEPIVLPNGERREVVPSDHFMFIPTENRKYAEYVVELLNSKPYQVILDQLSSKKKSSLPKKLLKRLYIPTEEEFLNLNVK